MTYQTMKVVTNANVEFALGLAHRMALQPELVVDAAAARRAILALSSVINQNNCLRAAALKNKEVFCLTSDDTLAPDVIDCWALCARARGVNHAKVTDARRIADRWRENKNARVPD